MADPVGDVCGVTPTAAAHSLPQGTPAPRNGFWHIFISEGVINMFGKVPYCVFALLFSLAGCTTEWAAEGSYYRTTQFLLAVESTPPGKILINGNHKGLSSNSKCNTTGPDRLRCCHADKIL